MKNLKKLIALLLAVLMMVAVFSACAPEPTPTPDPDPQPQPSNPDDPTPTPDPTPDPDPVPTESETPLVIQWDQVNGTDKFEATHVDATRSYHTFMMWEQLYQTDNTYQESDDGYYVWRLAVGFERSEDNTSITYTLRDDMVWSDGEPITVDDVVFSVMASIKDPISTQVAVYKDVVGYEALVNGEADTLAGMTTEGNTITFTMIAPSATMHYNPFVLPAHCFEGVAWSDFSNADYWYAPVTSGPYKFVDANYPDYVNLTRNELYYGEPAGIKNVTCVSFEAATNDAAIAAMISNQSDITTKSITSNGLLANQITDMNPDCVSIAMYSDNYRALIFNDGTRTDGKNKDILVNNPKARLAISLLVDEDTIADYTATLPVKVMGNPVNPLTTHEFDNANKSLDLEKAKKLLDEAGWDYNEVIEIFCYYTDQLSLDVLEIIKADAAKIGVQMKINVVAENSSVAMNEERNWDIMFYQAPGTAKHPASAGHQLCMTSRPYRNPESPTFKKYEELRDAWNAISDSFSPEGIAASQAIAAFNYENVDVIPIYTASSIIVYNTARIEIPETAFDHNDNVLDFHLWKMLA